MTAMAPLVSEPLASGEATLACVLAWLTEVAS
jgi:hypothetical protein